MSVDPVLGRPLRAELHTPALRAWFREHWIFPEHVLPVAPFRIRLIERERPPPLGTGVPARVALHRVALPAVRHDDGWSFGDAEAGVRLGLRLDAAQIDAWGAGGPAGRPRVLAALFLALGEALRASGLLPLHAAVVVRDGRATALTGASGVGKTSTLWRALDEGWAPLAEDFAWLDPATLMVYGWDRGVRLTPDARARFAPGLDREDARRDADGKLFVPYHRLAASRVPAARLHRLLRLERGERHPPGPAPLDDRDAVRTWWEAVGVPLAPEVRTVVADRIVALLRDVPTARLRLGAGPLAL